MIVGGLVGDHVEVVDDGNPGFPPKRFLRSRCSGRGGLASGRCEGVLDFDALVQSGTAIAGGLAFAQLAGSTSSGWMDTLRPLLLAMQRCRSGQAAQVSSGKCTVTPGWKACLPPPGRSASRRGSRG